MAKRENIDINYLNKFDKSRPESAEEENFNREMEIMAQEDISQLVEEGKVVMEKKYGGKDNNELKEVVVKLPNGKVVYYLNNGELEKFYENQLPSNTERKASVYDVDEPITLSAIRAIKKAVRSGEIKEERKCDDSRKNPEESTLKLADGTIVSYLNFKEINKITGRDLENQGIARKLNEKKQGKLSPSDNN